MDWFPKTRLGKTAVWLAISSFAGIYLEYWVALLGMQIPFFLGFLFMGVLLLSGALSVISIVKNKERAFLIFVASALGLLGLMFVIGELIFSH